MREGCLGLPKMQALTKDVQEAFIDHDFHVLCLCELGEHLVVLRKVKDWERNSQDEMINELVAEVDRLGPPLCLQLMSGSYPTYAFIGKPSMPDVSFGTLTWIRNLDDQVVAKHRLEHACPTLSLQRRGREVMLGNIHNPDSKKRPW